MTSHAISIEIPKHAEDVDEELRRTTIALETVFSPSNSTTNNVKTANEDTVGRALESRRDISDRYLTSFQRTALAWMVCDRILLEEDYKDSETMGQQQQRRFFAAQTLHYKCREEVFIKQLPGDSLPSLRDSLINHLTRFSSSGNRPLMTRLCMTVSALAVQMRWNSIISDVLEKVYRVELSSAVLELFQLLPEEAVSDRLFVSNEAIRGEFRESLRMSSEAVCSFLWHCFSSGGGDEERQRHVFMCMTVWVRNVHIPPALVESSPLLEAAFQAICHGCDLSKGDLFESAVDMIVEVLRMYGSLATANASLVHKIIPLVMGLGTSPAFQKALQEEDEDTLRGYCRIITEMGESYMDLIMGPQEMNQSALVQLVLQCSAISNHEIANITLHFWSRFVNCLDKLEPMQFRQHRIDYYTSSLSSLLGICTVFMQYPVDVAELQADFLEDITRDRYYISEAVEDCCRLLGGDIVLHHLGARLKEEYASFTQKQTAQCAAESWQGSEGCLSAIRSIARYVPQDENTFLPFVMELISRKLLPQDISFVRITCTSIVGYYAEWLDHHPNYLPSLVTYLAEGLGMPHSANASALALKQLCKSCTRQSLADPILQLYETIVAAYPEQSANNVKIDVRIELEVLEGLCIAVSRHLRSMTAEERNAPVMRIIQPIATRFASLMSNNSTTSRQVIAEIERLTVIIRDLEVPPQSYATEAYDTSIFLNLMTESWPLLDAVARKFTQDTDLAEKLCRLHKHALRKCGPDVYAPLLDPLLHHVVSAFCTSRQSPYLYAASICITEYGDNQEYIPKLFQMMSQLCAAVFAMLPNLEAVISHPDIVEEFFYLVGRFMNYCPEPLVASPLLSSLLQFAVVAMQVQHRDAHKGTLNFLEHTISYGLFLYNPDDPSAQSSSPTQEAFYKAILSQGQPIVHNLTLAILGELPAYCIDRGSGSISGILWKLNFLCSEYVVQWITYTLSQYASALPNTTCQADFMNALVKKVSRDEFTPALLKLCAVCDRHRKLGNSQKS